MTNLCLSLYEIDCHAQEYMKRLGIEYQRATPQSVIDSWWFWNCTNVPSPLPKGLTVLKTSPREAIGLGLSEEMAYAIETASKEKNS